MKSYVIPLLTIVTVTALAIQPAAAEGRHEGHHEGHWGGGERDIRHFENHHLAVWREGYWRHGRHEGRLGWWWIAAGAWYFYPEPIYPYPDPYVPPVVVVQPAPTPQVAPTAPPPAQSQSWYYCEASKAYYPYVATCPAGWKTVPANPSSAAPAN